jgi:hypothetical protein
MHSASLYSLSLTPPTVALSLSLCCFHLRLLLFHFLFVAFISNYCSFDLSLPMISCLCRLHLRLLHFHFPRFQMHSASLYSLLALSLCRVQLRLLLFPSLPTPHSLSLRRYHLRLLLFHFLFVAFISSCCSFALSLSNHSPLCQFHLRLLLFHFLFDAFISDCCSLALCFQMSLSPPTIALSLSLCRFRLYGGIGAGFRRNTFGFLAPSPLLYFSQSQRSLLIMSPCWVSGSGPLTSASGPLLCPVHRTRDKLFAGYPTGHMRSSRWSPHELHALFLGVQHCFRRYDRHSTF